MAYTLNPLGRLQPPDWGHVDKYPLAALASVDDKDLRPRHVPVAIGVNWYEGFDRPEPDGRGNYWVGLHVPLGSIRGGHCVCLEPEPDPAIKGGEQDKTAWWKFYDQGAEGSCEGHGHSRMMSLMNRKRYDAVWLYNEARKIDGDPDPNHEGTTNRATLEVLRTQGHRVAHGEVTTALDRSDRVSPAEGIAAYRWARTAEEVAHALGLPSSQEWAEILNSWGEAYPERVRIPLTVLARLLAEAGEAGVVTDR